MNHRNYNVEFEMNRSHQGGLGEMRAQERLARQATTTSFEATNSRAPTVFGRMGLRLAAVLRRGTTEVYPAPDSYTP